LSGLKAKRKVLVVLGWHDVRTLLALAHYARDAAWHLETRHFFNETLPHGWQGDGMIVSNPARADVLRFIRRQAPRQPTVLIELNNPGLRVPQVAEDNAAAGRLAAAHLLAMGHKHFAWWSPYPGRVPDERWRGFREALAEAGCGAERLEYRARSGENDWTRRRAWLVRRLRALPRPVALFALDDQLAAEAVEMCLESKLRVPQDVAVVGVGNIELACETSHVPITSVDTAPEEIALAGARLLDRLMKGGRAPNEPVLIPPRGLVVRQSSDRLAITHPAMLRAAAYVQQHLAEPLDTDRLAAASGLARRTLFRVFKAELRCSPAELLHRERTIRARRMLEESDASIKEVASACGFGTQRTMNRLFLRLEGLSPRAWRISRRSIRSLLDQHHASRITPHAPPSYRPLHRPWLLRPDHCRGRLLPSAVGQECPLLFPGRQ
jgi:LacI family transcriptional regulator